jgi:hypothetical protein
MTRRGLVILLLGWQLSVHAQTEQFSAVVFYTTEITGQRPILVLYSNGQKIGEVRQDQSIRLIVRPGTYRFKLTEDAQLPVSIGTGQELFLRVTRTAFFLGNATEASASPWIVAPSSFGTQLNGIPSTLSPTSVAADGSSAPTSSDATFIPEPSQHQERVPRPGTEPATRGVLRCAFSGTLTIHSALQPASPVLAKIRCGDPVLLIDHSYMYPHVRTEDGKVGYILSLNLGQWAIDTQTQSMPADYVIGPARSQVVLITGNVARPGSYRLGGPVTIMELLARAGGLVDFANKQEITIVRSEGGKTHREIFNYKRFVEGKNQQDILLQNGDVIVVP